jgi:hypothetical protein
MSYKGYVDVLCKNGHKYGWDAMDEMYGDADQYKGCPICGAPVAFRWDVDKTNGIEEENPYTLDYPFEEATRAEYETCPTCNHCKLVKHETYKIPTQEDVQKHLQKYGITEDDGSDYIKGE